MGYTHYWSLKDSTISQKNFDKVLKDVKKIENALEHTEEKLFDGVGRKLGVCYTGSESNGKFEADGFLFNGNSAEGEDHETMSLHVGENDWSFCKTARKPYDIAVCMVLLSLKYHVRSTNVSSDGDGSQDEWGQAFDLWKTIFNRSVSFKFKEWKADSKTMDGSLSIIAFTGNKFEFRAVGSTANCSAAMVAINIGRIV